MGKGTKESTRKQPGQKGLLFPLPHQEKIEELEARIKILNDICLRLNPYEDIPSDLKMSMMNFNILDFSDPFKITNTLLMLLEDSIDELHALKPFVDDAL